MRSISFLLFLLCLCPLSSQAQQGALSTKKDTGLGIGYALVRFDTSVKFTDKQNNQTVFVDTEGTLDLPDWDTIPVFYGNYRFTSKHAIGFSYFEVRRESSIFDFDETLDDVTITGTARFLDDTRFFNIYYAYTLFEDERSYILWKFGINALDIRYVLEAEGTITYDDMTTGSYLREDTGVFAPMPLLGLDFWYAFTPKWGISSKVSLVAGNFDDYRGWVANTNIYARYNISKHFGAIFGISYFDADIIIEDDVERTDVQYSYDGVFLGMHALF
jgi:hypothetical protein